MKPWTTGLLGLALLTALETGAAADLSENFDASTALPVGWVNGGTVNWNNASHYQSAPNCRALAANQSLQTPLVDYPTNLAFYVDCSNAGNGKTATVDYSLDGGATWGLLGSFAVGTAGSTRNYPLNGTPNLALNTGVRFRFNSTFATWYLDNVVIRTGGAAASNGPPMLSLTPPQTNRVVLIGEEVRVTVGAVEADGDEITLSGFDLPAGASFEPNPKTGISPLTNDFVWTPAAPGFHSLTFAAADKDGTNQIGLVLYAYEEDPTLLLSENFDGTADVPAGWENAGSENHSEATHYASAPNCRAMGSNDTLNTPGVDYPTNLSFYADASSAGNGKTATVSYRIGTNEWLSVGTFAASTAGATVSFSLLDLPGVSVGTNVQFRFASTFMTWYLDDVVVRGQRLADQPPTLAPIGPQAVALGQTLAFAVVATDFDGDDVALYASNLPPGVVFDAVTNAGAATNWFTFTPQPADTGLVYATTFYAADTNGVSAETVAISVYDRLIGFAAAASETWEGDGPQAVAVVLSRPGDVAVDVVVGGTAASGPDGDYVLAATNLAFTADGSATQYVEFAVLDDSLRENTETVVLTLTNAVGADLDPQRVHVASLRDNEAALFASLDANPGWAVQGAWAFGRPLGGGGSHGYPDPSAGFTGTNVYGYNLNGDYANNVATTHYLTTPAIDCTRFHNVRLDFQRWLGVEYSVYDQAVIQASRDRTNWVDVWRHSGYEITDAAWTNVVYDLSAIADGESAVQIRWGLGPTDEVWTYCGWNLDDVALVGDYASNAMFRFAAVGWSVRETSGVARVTIERVGRTNGAAEIVFVASNGTATAGADYEAVEETLLFAPGERSRTVLIPVLDDADVEGEETVDLRLVPTPTGDAATPAQAVLILLDDEAPGAAMPFFDGFEAEALSNCWRGTSTGAGRIQAGPGSNLAFEGMRQLCLDSSQFNVAGLNEMVLTADLAGQTNVVLDFQEYNYDYELQPMPARFAGSVAADGVAVSADGVNWHRLFEMPTAFWGPYGYTNRAINLSAFAASNGLALGANFKIKFQQVDVYPLPYRGRCFDNVQLYDPTQVADVRLSIQESEDPTLIGSNLVYRLLLTNAGPRGVSNLVVSNQLPAGVDFVSATTSQGNCVRDGDHVVGQLGAFARGKTAVVVLTLVPPAVGLLTNRAVAWSEVTDPFRTNNVAVATTMADERGGTLQVQAASVDVSEAQGNAGMVVLRSGRTYGSISVNYATADGTATAGADYTPRSGALTFTNGQTAAYLAVAVANDSLDEPTETFTFSISGPDGGAELGERITTSVSILDDDGRAAFPFQETFESGAFSNYWRTYSTGSGRLLLTTNNGPHAGERHLTMDAASYGSSSLNEMVLTVDLAGRQGITLEFWHRTYGNQDHLMPATFAGHANADGVAISMDGTNWAKVQGLTFSEGGSNTYRRFEVRLDPIVAARGWTYNSTFKIKFQQYDNYPIPYRGFAFDDIALFSRPGELRFRQADYAVAETGGVAVVAVERVNGSLGEVTVQFAAADGTATAPADYAATNGVLTFPDGVTTGSFAVAIVDDADDEPAETIRLILSDPTGGAALATPSNSVLTLRDDDGAGEFAFAADVYAATETNGWIQVSVDRQGGAAGEASVDVVVSAGSAVAGEDFNAATGTLVFAAGATNRSFAVELLDDAVREDTETVHLALVNPSLGAAIGSPASATLNVLDNEDPNYDYYLPAYGKEGVELRQALHDIIDDHLAFSYDTLWTILQETDECPTNPAQVQLVYLQMGRDKNNNGGSAGQWNREHVWPQSHGFPDALSTSVPPSVDAHNLKPADVQVNSLRGEKDFDAGGETVAGAPPTCRTTADTFEPPDASKGDVARMMFYMDVRYSGDKDGEPDLELVDAINTSGAQLGKRSTLIQWHFQDPPDDFEKRRNNLIYANWQRNRNPFIDHPEWVLKVWEYNLAIATVAGAGGRILPENPQVPYHSDQLFEILPEPYWHVADVRTNGISLGAAYGTSTYAFTWHQVVATGVVEVLFAPNLAPLGTPEWWLADCGFSNDFAAAETSDLDMDGQFAWQEFRANTRPDDPSSLLAFEEISPEGVDGHVVLRWQSASNRFYTLWRSTNLLDDFAHPLATNVPADYPVNVYTDEVAGSEALFYRIEVEP